MRHVYIRGFMGFLWLAAAVLSSLSANFAWTVFYVLLGGVFLYSAYTTWKREKDNKGGR